MRKIVCLFKMKSLILFCIVQLAMADDVDWANLRPLHPEISPPPGYQPPQKLPENRIVHGKEVERNSVPYQVALFIEDSTGTYFCGGSLISKRYVLTAAHCIMSGAITVYLGAHNIREVESTQIRLVSEEFIVHKDYDAANLVNDIALIKLPQDVKESNVIKYVKLPRHQDKNQSFAGCNATTTGWGRISDSAIAISNTLNTVTNVVITNKDCRERFFGSVVEDVHICMEYPSTCNGDSGGPMTCHGRQVGVTSFGIIFGCEAGWPSGFTRVTKYLKWLATYSDVIIEK